MTPILIKDLGLKYPTEKSRQRYRYGLYQCQYCGKEFEAMVYHIKMEHTKSCGCLHIKRSTKHGYYLHDLYSTWDNMCRRCNNPKHKEYKNYGARGIKVCDRWMDVGNFIEDMYPSWVEGLTLDRVDVNGNYEPDNCRWVTNEIQHRNTRDIQSNNTSGFRGVSWDKRRNKWVVSITVNNKQINLGRYQTALEGAKRYESYVRVNNLEHNFTPALTEEEVDALKKKGGGYK